MKQRNKKIAERRKRRVLSGIIAVVLVAAMGLGMFLNFETKVQAAPNTVVDPNTTNVWTNYTRPGGQPSTQNVGRIWTDKSVFNGDYSFTNDNDTGLNGETIRKGNSDFLVSLSALSSTSNLKEMVKTSQPLDIALVLDTSGSMSGSKMTNLKNAANSFIDATAENNRGLEQNQQTRLAIVQFASGANTQQQLNYVTDQNAQQYKNTINRFSANGATWAEAGLQQAQNELDQNGRADVQQIVIFFTDGEPNHGNGFDNEVAADAVNTAHEMKQSGTIIYAIGVMNGADASVTDDDGFNEYMNGVSSNYPDAIADGDNGTWYPFVGTVGAHYNTTFGERAEGNYYKAASDPDSIEEIFDEISDEVQQGVGSGSPIEENTQQGNIEPGTLTFEDQLGNYMQVTGTGAGDDRIQFAYGDQIYTSKSKTTAGNVDTYHFEGKVDGNAVYGAADLADLTVTVTRSDDLATGDTVTVTIPASLIPLRNYDVDTDTNAMTVSPAYPVRLFYGVSLKDGAKEALKNPASDDYAAILQTQKSEDGKTIDFYSNSFTKGAADGSTTATFQPNAGNKFYYYTQDATLYIDQNCQTEATQWNISRYDTLYWKDTYWVQTDDGVGEERSTGVAIQRGTAEWNAMESTGVYNGTYYIPAGTPRSDRPATMTAGKDQNNTGTADNVLNPSWIGNSVSQALGNNGKLSYDMPGSLEIKKTVNWGNASDSTKQNPDKNKFEFEITANVPADEGDVAEPLNGTYNYYVGDSEDAAGQVVFTDSKAELTIEGGTTVRIDGMPAGAAFTVTEKGVGQNGWTVTDATSQEGAENTNTTDGIVTGTIPAGSQVSLTFDNAYKAADVKLSTKTALSVKKDLEGRDWRDADEFTFEIDGLGNTAGDGITTPEPAETTVTIDDQTADYTKAFGDITFTMPGEYRYSITEDNDTDPINGIDYSAAIYRVVVTVTDDGNGKLVVSKVELQQTQNDAGTMGVDAQPVPIEGSTATFTNTYDVNAATTNIDGRKKYTDTTGDNDINHGKFTFQIEALGGYETEGGSSASYTVKAEDVPMPTDVAEGTTTKQVTNTGYRFTFGTISYDGNDAGKTFEYKVTEIPGNEQGMTYDGTTEHIVKVKVEEVTTGEGTPEEETHLVATPDMTPVQVSFTNTYDPDDATLTGDTAIRGTKTFTGRDMEDDEEFYFQLTQTSGPVVDAETGEQDMILDQPKIVEIIKDEMQNGSADFDFGDMAFSRTGEYKFTVNEVAPDGQGGYTETANGSGMTYDTNICTVTVNVTDNKQGALVADVTYSNDVNTTVTDKAQFNNTYKASMNYGAEGKGGIVVTKQLTNRPMDAKEFAFSITGVANDSGKTTAEDANKKLTEEDKSFNNTAAAADQIITMAKLQNVSFDQTDAGKTYSYIVDETTEDDAKTLPGVNCDETQYRVDIQVVDNGDGTMHTLTIVTKIKNAAGKEVNENVIDAANSGNQSYTAPKFGFVNEYNPTPATVGEDADDKIEVTKKVTGAPSPDGVSYSFTLTATGDNIGNITGLDDKNQLHLSTNGTINAGESQTMDFGKLTFSQKGTYTFTVQEDTPDADDGWTYDTDPQTVTIVVTDVNDKGQYDGKLYIQSVTGSPVEITNSYKPGSVIVGGEGVDQQITVQKSVTGADSTAEFQFKIEMVDEDDPKWDNVEVADDSFSDTISITDGVTQGNPKTANFAGIQFNATGEYQFKITEVGAADFNVSDNRNGWTYDEHEAIVTVKVTDDNFDGKLDATVSYDNSYAITDADKAVDNAAAFTNTYNASGSLDGDADGNLTVTKNYTSNLGNPWTPDDSFGFTLAVDMTDQTTAEAVNNSWITLPENAGSKDKAGITIDDETEDYQASFGNIKFTKAGTYKFTVQEVLPEGVNTDNPTKNGITYDTSVKTVTVNVTDNGDGTLTATVAEESDELTFNNTYNVQPVMFRAAYFALQGNKVLDGRNWEQGDTFTFTMTAGRGTNPDGTQMAGGVVEATMPKKTTDTIEPLANDGSWVSDNSAQFTFTDERYPSGDVVPDADDVFTFTQPGIYRYLIAETNPNASNPGSGILGVTYDQTQYRLTVEVKDDGNGNLVVESSKFSSRPTAGSGEWTDIASDQGITFTNKYSANEVGVSFNAAKVLNGRDTAMDDNEFMFHMAFAGWMSNDGFDAQSDNWSMDGEVAEKAPAAAADKGNIIRGDVIFDNVTFTSDNVGYTYRYAITEIIPDDATNAAYAGVAYEDANAEQKAAAGWTKNGVTYDGSTKYVTARVTSEQTQDQQNPGTYIEVVRVATGGEAPYNEQTGKFEGGAIFTNTYDAGSTDVDTGTAEAQLTKVLTGKAWDGDKFTFKIEAVSNTAGIEVANQPMPAQTEVTVDKATDGNKATFSFGKISYDTPGSYVYKVTEVVPGIDDPAYNAGITYSTNVATITVSVEDNNNGGYTTGVTVADNVFTNKYASELNFAAAGGLEIVKTFENADMREFSFTVTPNDSASAKKLGIDMAGKTFTTTPGATIGDDNASHTEIMVIDVGTEAKFTQDDADDTYTYTVQETKGTDESVDYDDTVYTVTITTVDDGLGGIKVTTKVTDGADYNQSYVYDNDDATENQTAVVPFTNTYKATGELGGKGSVSIKATKTLTNRPMVDGEFTFNVTNTKDPSDTVVATGINDANGTIKFNAINYSIDQMLKDVDNGLAAFKVVDGKNIFTYQYTVAEDHASFDKGVTAIADSFDITVTVTDNGDGTLGIAVAYPDGSDGLTFRNAYGEGDQGKATLNIAGEKKLDVQSGNNTPNIEGKYTFTLAGEDGAPMPAQTTATNDAAGNVNFGDITYTMENVFGDTGVQADAPTDETAANADTGEAAVDGEASGESGSAANAADIDIQSAQRTKTFTYTVTESGTVEGVDNDAQTSKTFTVMITDNGKGTISAVSDPAQGAKFSFTNTYSVDPTDSSLTGDGNLTITKKLTGRDLAEGEFKVVMTDKDGAEAASGTNDVQGNIGLSAITFTQPGDYTYDLYEAAGDKGGVTYDSTRYIATAHVEDKGNGTLEVTWSVTDVEGNPIDGTEITFNNTYKAEATSVSLGTGKLIEGRDLEAGEFSFLLSDKDGNEISTAKNEKNGAVTFDTITYDKAGTYEYNISEVLPKDDDSKTDGIQKDNVTYDESVYQVTVEVTDDNAGHLSASVTYKDRDGAPLFVNKYTKPADNTPAGNDGGGTILGVKTGDVAEILPLLIVMAAAIIVIIAMSVILIRRRRR